MPPKKGKESMIEQLMVKNYILFESAIVDFKRDMTVITGETGAGKSLLIDAISLLMGNRASSSVVRKGKDQAVLQMVLSEPEGAVKELLEENGYDSDELIITRIITDKNKSKMRINGQAATLSFVKELCSKLIDIHSQMDTITLMDPAVQLELLDQYAKVGDLKAETAAAFKEYAKSQREYIKASKTTYTQDELDRISKEMAKIDEEKIQPQELEELQKQIEEAENSADQIEAYDQSLQLLKREGGITESLYTLASLLQKKTSFEKEAGEVENMYFSLLALTDDIQNKKDAVSNSAMDLDEMQSREFQIKRMFKKYGGSYETLMEARKELEERAENIIHREDLLEKLDKKRKQAYKTYLLAARNLSKKRQSVFEELENKIVGHAKDLMLENCRFKIVRQEKKPSASGIDEIDFQVSMNPGQPLSSLKTSASGGELARLMLALKVVFQSQSGIDTIVFDEIDTGVSGKVALAMGSKMHALAENYQVLCITHLPSVAVWSDSHYRVSKHTDGSVTTTQINKLNAKEDLEELAIMANGTATQAGIESMAQLKEQVHG